MSSTDLHKVFETTQSRLIALYIISTLCIVSGCITIYGLIILWKLRCLPYIQKRHPALVLATSISIILTLVIERPLSAISRLSQFASDELSWARWILHVICFQTQYICVLFRIYITCFDVSFAKATAASLWMKHIDIHSKCKKSSWTVQHYAKWGNLRNIYLYIIAIIASVIAIVITIRIIDSQWGALINAIFLFIFTVIMCVMWRMTPQYLDYFKIRVEIRLVLIIQCCLLVIYGVYFVLELIPPSITYGEWLMVQFCAIFFTFLLGFTQTIWVLNKFKIALNKKRTRGEEYSITESVFSKSNNSWNYGEEQEKDIVELDILDVIREPIGFEAFMNHLSKEFSMENLLALIEFNQYKTRYREIKQVHMDINNGVDPLIRTSSKISTIMVKVMKKLSVAVQNDNDGENGDEQREDKDNSIDACAIQHMAQDDDDIVINKEESDDPKETVTLKQPTVPATIQRSTTLLNVTEQTVKLPSELPFSTIVFGDHYNPDDNTKNIENIQQMTLKTEAIRIIQLLYTKYIMVGSEMELNLSHRLRKRCLDKLSAIETLSDLRLEHMFDKCIVVLLKLMQDSYSRFRETKDFIRYEEKANKRARNESIVTKDSLGGIFGDLM